MSGIPVSLENAPIIEAIAEIRFETNQKDGASTILGGGLYAKFRERFPNFERMQTADVPYSVRAEQHMNTPLMRMGNGSEFIVIGDHSLAFSTSGRYPGWAEFRKSIELIWQYANELQCIDRVTRVALKYVNLLSIENGNPSSIALSIADKPVKDCFYNLEMRFFSNQIESVVHVVSSAAVQFENEAPRNGMIVSVDTSLGTSLDDFWANFDATLEALHTEEKTLFFRLLSENELDNLRPRYG